MNERIALIIANGEYDDVALPRLETPANDAQALADVLRDPALGNFEVTLLIDEPARTIRQGIETLYKDRKRNDLLLLYYSGHGILDKYDDLYLATRDTDNSYNSTALEAISVRDRIDKSNSLRKIVILDCCYSGAFTGKKAALGGSVETQRAFGSGYGRVILTASDAFNSSWEGDRWLEGRRLSVFTHFIIEGLRTGEADSNKDGEVSVNELYDYVYEQIRESEYAKQKPLISMGKGEGQIIIAHAPVKAEEPAPSLSIPSKEFDKNKKIYFKNILQILFVLGIGIIGILLELNSLSDFSLTSSTLTPTSDLPVVTPTVTPISNVAPPLGVVDFSDSFSNNEAQLTWSTGSGGERRVINNQLQVYAQPMQGKSRNWKTYVAEGPDPRNAYICKEGTIQVDVSIPDDNAPRGVGIVLGYNDSKDFFQFTVTGAAGEFSTWQVYKGPSEDPTSLTPVSALNPIVSLWYAGPDMPSISGYTVLSKTFTLRVDVHMEESAKGEKYGLAEFYANGRRLGETYLKDYLGGKVGVVVAGASTEGGTALFDNFTVALLGKNTP